VTPEVVQGELTKNSAEHHHDSFIVGDFVTHLQDTSKTS
jgi:hypothetical protein